MKAETLAKAVTLAVVTAELRLRLDRLERHVRRAPPPPRPAISTSLDRYEALCKRIRAQRGQS